MKNLGDSDSPEKKAASQIEAKEAGLPDSLCIGPWRFSRRWRYWQAAAPEGHGLPGCIADYVNELWGGRIRAAGFAGGLSSEQMVHHKSLNGTMDLYHIDSEGGLAFLARTINFVESTRGGNQITSEAKVERFIEFLELWIELYRGEEEKLVKRYGEDDTSYVRTLISGQSALWRALLATFKKSPVPDLMTNRLTKEIINAHSHPLMFEPITMADFLEEINLMR